MIADHARKDTLTGSLSWKFVTESVHNGAIQLEDRYRIGPDPDIPRPSGSGQPTKTTRTPFTHEEDVLLARFLLSHPDHQTGNNIYHDLGLKHPQHPWQSWRSRFVKKMKPHGLAYLQRLAGEEVGATGEPTDPPVTPRPKLPTQSNVACSSPTALDQTSAEPSSGKLPQITTPNRQNTQQQGHTPKPRIPAASRPLVAETSPSTATQEGTHQSARQTTPECALIQADAGLAAEQSRFYGDLKDYAEAVGLDVELENRIGDKIVDLYELSQAVLAQKVPIIEVDWMRVAEDLGYDWNKGQQVLRELQTYYDENLAEFVDGMVSFNEEKVIEEREQEPEPEPAQERIQDQVKQQGQEQEQGPGQEQNPEQERNQGHEKGRGRVQGRENGRSLEVNISSPTPTRSMGRKRPLDHVDQIDQRPATASPQNVAAAGRCITASG
ncbi:hypothetical protein RJ55_00801 [Drechmeria coniospora]|nr:hypothetical protein RJ55_00801 [Drechmeria coniospora]